MPEKSFFGSKIQSAEIVFFSQIVSIYIIICTSLHNLSVGSEPANLWITLLSSCVGYLLPGLVLELKRQNVLPDSSR